MGDMRHHAIIVSGGDWGEKDAVGYPIHRAHAKAVALGCTVMPIVQSPVNGWFSFLIATDGSKEGWDASEVGDEQRTQFRAYCESVRYDDRSSHGQKCNTATTLEKQPSSVTVIKPHHLREGR